jgi:hypothetical protein
LIPALLLDLEVSYLDPRYREVGYLEFELNGNSRVLLSLLALDAGEAKLSSHHVLLAARELLDAPYHGVLVWDVLDGAYIRLEDR